MLLIASTGPEEKCEVPADPAYPLCAQKVEVSSPKAGYRGHVYCILTVCLAVSAGPLAVRPLLCLLWGGWYPLLYIDVPQQNRGLLSASSWKKPLGSAVASKAALLYREGSNTADWGTPEVTLKWQFLRPFWYYNHSTDWDPYKPESTVWRPQQQQQPHRGLHALQSEEDVWSVDQSWTEDEAEGQQHGLEADEGIKFEILPKKCESW